MMAPGIVEQLQKVMTVQYVFVTHLPLQDIGAQEVFIN